MEILRFVALYMILIIGLSAGVFGFIYWASRK